MSPDVIECAYCGRDVSDMDQEVVPNVADGDAWEALAREHGVDCEWIATRAHRQEA